MAQTIEMVHRHKVERALEESQKQLFYMKYTFEGKKGSIFLVSAGANGTGEALYTSSVTENAATLEQLKKYMGVENVAIAPVNVEMLKKALSSSENMKMVPIPIGAGAETGAENKKVAASPARLPKEAEKSTPATVTVTMAQRPAVVPAPAIQEALGTLCGEKSYYKGMGGRYCVNYAFAALSFIAQQNGKVCPLGPVDAWDMKATYKRSGMFKTIDLYKINGRRRLEETLENAPAGTIVTVRTDPSRDIPAHKTDHALISLGDGTYVQLLKTKAERIGAREVISRYSIVGDSMAYVPDFAKFPEGKNVTLTPGDVGLRAGKVSPSMFAGMVANAYGLNPQSYVLALLLVQNGIAPKDYAARTKTDELFINLLVPAAQYAMNAASRTKKEEPKRA